MVGTQFFQHLGRGGVALAVLLVGREVQLIEKHGPQLFGGGDVEGMPGYLVDGKAVGLDGLLQHGREVQKPLFVDQHSPPLHGKEDLCQRKLQIPIEREHSLLLQLLLHGPR